MRKFPKFEGVRQSIIWPFFAKNYVKMKEIGPGGVSSTVDPADGVATKE